MRGDVKVKAGERDVTLRLTLGAMEEVSEVEIAPAVILGALQTGVYTAKELGAVLRAGLKAAGESMTAGELVEAIGGVEAARVASDLLKAFFRLDDASGNADAAGKRKAKATAS